MLKQFLSFLLMCLFFLASHSSTFAAKLSGVEQQAFQSITEQFTKSKTMSGDFIQFHPDGQQSEGQFYIKRPGKVFFDYKPPSVVSVKADGKTIGIHNSQLNTWDYYPLRKSPLRLILAEEIDIEEKSIQSVTIDEELVTINVSDKSLFGNSKIALMFNPKSYDLRQWTVKDQQGKETTVIIYNVKYGNDEAIADDLFVLEENNN